MSSRSRFKPEESDFTNKRERLFVKKKNPSKGFERKLEKKKTDGDPTRTNDLESLITEETCSN